MTSKPFDQAFTPVQTAAVGFLATARQERPAEKHFLAPLLGPGPSPRGKANSYSVSSQFFGIVIRMYYEEH